MSRTENEQRLTGLVPGRNLRAFTARVRFVNQAMHRLSARAPSALLAPLLCVALAGCAAPGMKLDAKSVKNSNPGAAGTADIKDRADVYAISAQTITNLAAQARAETGRGVLAKGFARADEPHVYLIGAQDVLRITVWNHPELTNPSGTANELSGRIVNADGTFFFPFVGRVMAAGRTVQQIRDDLARGLSPYLKTPQIDVSVLQYRSKRFFVTGEVRTPSTLAITDIPPNLTEAMTQAGGATQEADLSAVTITRGDVSQRVDLYALFYGGDVSQNLRLQEGDVIHVPERRFNKVFVLGEVNRPNSLPMPRGRLTLAEALSDSGGVNPLSANAGQIYVIRGGSDGPGSRSQIYHLNAAAPDALILADRFDLRARDVVFVDAAPIVRWARIMANILPTADFLRETLNDTTRAFPR